MVGAHRARDQGCNAEAGVTYAWGETMVLFQHRSFYLNVRFLAAVRDPPLRRMPPFALAARGHDG